MHFSKAEQLLGLVPPYGPADLTKAFRRKSHETHPDKGGEAEDFKSVSKAKELLERILGGEKIQYDDPVEQAHADVRARTEAASQVHERSRQDANSRSQAMGQYSPNGHRGGRVPPQEDILGTRFTVFHIGLDGRPHPGAKWFKAWVATCGKKNRLAVAFQPPSPIQQVGEVDCVLVLEGGEVEDGISFTGRVVERCHDRDGMVTLFFVEVS